MMSIQVVKPDWKVPSHVKACTTTVHGGVSKGVYKGLNLGDHVNDDLTLVSENRLIVKKELGLPNEPSWLTQVHGVEVVDANSSLKAESLMAEGSQITAECSQTVAEGSQLIADGSQITADGSYTFSPGVVCAILTADCMPLFLSSKSGDRVALLHAGWRGLADGIIERGVDRLDCARDELVAWAGPCIGPDAFEIGDEVRQQLGGADSAYKRSSNSTGENVKWFANLYQLAGERLASIGVHQYSHSQVCTYTDERFYSYRRTGQCGRMASFIWIDKPL